LSFFDAFQWIFGLLFVIDVQLGETAASFGEAPKYRSVILGGGGVNPQCVILSERFRASRRPPIVADTLRVRLERGFSPASRVPHKFVIPTEGFSRSGGTCGSPDERYPRQLPPEVGGIALAVLGMMQHRINNVHLPMLASSVRMRNSFRAWSVMFSRRLEPSSSYVGKQAGTFFCAPIGFALGQWVFLPDPDPSPLFCSSE